MFQTHWETEFCHITFEDMPADQVSLDIFVHLYNVFEQVAQSGEIKAIFIDSAGDFFPHPEHYLTPPPDQENPIYRFFECLATFPKYMIITLRQDAMGAGVNLLSYADMILPKKHIFLHYPNILYGQTMFGAASQQFRKKFGDGIARRLQLLGDMIPIEEISGLAYAPISSDIELEGTKQRMMQILRQIPFSLVVANKDLLYAQDETLSQSLKREWHSLTHFNRCE